MHNVFAQPESRKEFGPIPELELVTGTELLSDASHKAQYVWVKVYGLQLLKDELPKIYAAWESDSRRQLSGGVACYIRAWLQNCFERQSKEKERLDEAKERDNDKRAKPPGFSASGMLGYNGAAKFGKKTVDTGKACKPAGCEGPDGFMEMPGVCSVHRSYEKCVIEGRA